MSDKYPIVTSLLKVDKKKILKEDGGGGNWGK